MSVSKVVRPPVSAAQLQDPREFQLGQIRRRFTPTEKTEANGTVFSFQLVPSDPDFPFEVEAFQCSLVVPQDYPQSAGAKLRILNKDIPRGFQINIEHAFEEIAAATPGATLLGLLNRLDKALADVLSRPMAETVKIYRPAGPAKPEVSSANVVPKTAAPMAAAVRTPTAPSWNDDQKREAAQKRQVEVRQLVARLGKAPGFVQSADDVTFTLPPTVYRTNNSPATIKQASSLQLIVPQLYPLVSPRIHFGGVRSQEADNAVAAFEERAKSQKAASLLVHVNYLSQNLHFMGATVHKADMSASTAPSILAADPGLSPIEAPKEPAETLSDKPHVHIIPRPLEWMQPQNEDDDSSDGSYSGDSNDDEDAHDIENQKAHEDTVHAPSTGVAERGILMSLPNLELHGIELLELTSLSLTVRCNRCKELSDFERLRNNTQADHTGMKEQGCKKCASSLAAGYRMDLIHVNSSRAGYIDLDGCTAVDMLPSTFVPTCGECSTAYTTPGCVSVRGDSTMAVCRECHHKMSE